MSVSVITMIRNSKKEHQNKKKKFTFALFSLLLLLISSCLLALDSRCVWSCSEHTVSLFLFAKLLKNVHVRLLPVSGSTPPLRTVKYSPLRVYSPYIPTDMTEVWKLPRARRVWYARAADEWPSHQEREREREAGWSLPPSRGKGGNCML